MHWTYYALSRTGQIIEGSFRGSRKDTIDFIQQSSFIVLDIKFDYRRNLDSLFKSNKLNSSVLTQFFEDFYNMLDTGISLNQIIQTLSETCKDPYLRNILVEAQQRMREGEGLAQALEVAHKFPWIVQSTLTAGEKTGRLKESVYVLSQYFKRSAQINSKIMGAAIYPVIVFIVLIFIMFFVSINVVPKLQGLLPPAALNNYATQCVLFFSNFLQHAWGWMVGFILVCAISFYSYFQEHKEDLEDMYYRIPLVGNLIKESGLALYFLNLSVLLKSGIPLMKAISDLEVSSQNVISRKLGLCKANMLGGTSFSDSLRKDNFFPSIVPFTVRKGEELAQIDQYCHNLSEYFLKRVSNQVDVMINLVQPILLIFGGLFLVVIAFAFLVPIYGSLTKIAGG